MKRILLSAGLAMSLAGAVFAQQAKKGIMAEGGGVDERGSARVLYWDLDAKGGAGEFAVNYGRPAWKKEYEDPAKFDKMTKGQVWRMGSNFWTELPGPIFRNQPLLTPGKIGDSFSTKWRRCV